jgi:hypothetical protein
MILKTVAAITGLVAARWVYLYYKMEKRAVDLKKMNPTMTIKKSFWPPFDVALLLQVSMRQMRSLRLSDYMDCMHCIYWP